MRTAGYHGVSMQEVMAAAAVRPGSVYHHFPGGKEQLAAAAVEHGGGAIAELLAGSIAAAGTVAEGLDRFLAASAKIMEDSRYRHGCPVGTVVADSAAHSESIREASGRAFDRWVAIVADALAAAGRPAAEAREQALNAVSLMEGALLLARAQQSVTPLAAARTATRTLLADDEARGPRVAGLVLAAGAGTRFGRPKAFVEFEGRSLIEHAVDLLRRGGCDPVLVVLGAGLETEVLPPGLPEVVINDDWRTGASSSLQRGLAALEGRAAAVMIALADQPRIEPEAVRRVRAAWEGGAEAAVATWDGQPGHPVLLDASIWDAVRESATGDVGARAFLRAHPDRVVSVPCDGLGDPADVDTPDDLQALSER